jgi:hypothetical protein
MSRFYLDRRTVLRGMLGATAITVALPRLNAFLNDNGTAYAAGGALPRRFGFWYWGNGNIPEKWVPAKDGTEFELSEQLLPLATHRNDFSVISGLKVNLPNVYPHGSGPAGFFTGADMLKRSDGSTTFAKPTFDQLIAQAIGGDTRFRSLEVGVQRGVGAISANGPDNYNPPETSPAALFQRLFGENFTPPGETPIIDPKLGLQRSVLDAVLYDAKSLRNRLGSADKARLDQHLDGVRDLELRIQRLQQSPPSLASCALPGQPQAAFPDVDGRPQMREISKAMADIVAMACACDMTRVWTNVFSGPVANVLYPGRSAGHHQLTHDEGGDQPEVNEIMKFIMASCSDWLDALKAIPEGDGTLLDNCAVLISSDVSWGHTHSLEDYPIVLAGRAGGVLKPGFHYRSYSGDNISKFVVSLLRVMGLTVGEFGSEEGTRATEGLSVLGV